jgi:elongator complex protein 4
VVGKLRAFYLGACYCYKPLVSVYGEELSTAIMPFQRKGTIIGSPKPSHSSSANLTPNQPPPAGVRQSPLDGRPTTSTGTPSLDRCFGGHLGLPLGTSVLVEETGTTDFAGVVARYYAAEGLVQGHHVHVLGYGESWKADLPGLANHNSSTVTHRVKTEDTMKIAWRYEKLGNGMSRRGGWYSNTFCQVASNVC